MPDAVIRPVQRADEPVVGRIAYATGFFGQSAAQYFPAPELFAALWVGPYFQGGGFAGFVAEHNGEVVGYILGAPSAAQYAHGVRHTIPHILSNLPSPPALQASLRYLLRAARHRAPHAPQQQYPAHLHLNLLAAARGQHLGEQLLHAHLNTLWGAGVPGVQLSTTTENVAALNLYQKLGFQVLASRETNLWWPWLGRNTTQVVMGCKKPNIPN